MFIFDLISTALLLCLSLVVSFVPIVKIGSSSLGNTWQVLARLPELLKDGGETVTLSAAMTNFILLIPAAITVSVLLFSAVHLASAFVFKNDEGFYSSKRFPLPFSIVRLAVTVILAILFSVAATDLGKWYGVGLHVYILLLGLFIVKTAMDAVITSLTADPPQGKFVKPQIAIMRLLKMPADLLLISSIVVIAYFSLTFRGALPFSSVFHMPDGYYAVSEITTQNAGSYYDFFNKNSEHISIIIERSNPVTKYSYSTNYRFYDNFIESTKKRIKEMYPEEFTTEAFEKYTKDCEALEKDIELAKELRDSSYCVYESKRYEDTVYDSDPFFVRQRLNMSAGENATYPKWETREDPLAYEKGESITLSRTAFSTTTDFSKIQLCAYITYKDGSKQFTLITIDNAAELNTASSGTHTLRFRDDWGSYGVAITIN